ncbi:MAG: hypothetical protein MUD12_03310 [Spirochaetes bacterium]|jgi:hypothetical protein|nr:hypothetical protein [Spirochaetota bacterium]
MIRKLIVKAALLAVASLGSIILYNYIIDCYSVLRRNINQIEVTPNDKYVKINYILNNKEKFDSFVFGSSRAAHIHAYKLKEGKWYNMFYWMGIPTEWLKTVRVLLKNNVRIKNIMLAIDEYSYTVDRGPIYDEYLFTFYPETFTDRADFFFKYMVKQPDLIELKDMYKPIKKWGLVFDFEKTGCYYLRKLERDIELNPQAHMNSGVFIHGVKNRGNRVKDFMYEITEIDRLCRENNINLIFVFNPIISLNYELEDMDLFVDMKKRVAGVRDYWDFSGFNSIGTNFYYFTDILHYRPVVGDMMLSRIFNENIARVPGDFGIHVTKDNVERYAGFLKEQMDYYKKTRKVMPFNYK